MAAFADVLDLRVAVAEHVGNRNISDVFPRLIQQAETRLNQKLRHRRQITGATLTFVAGESPLPSDYLEMINVFDPWGATLAQGSLADVKRCGSQYYRYAVDGANVIIFGLDGTRDVDYFAALPTISSSISASNWLLASFPSVYLYAVGVEAAKFLRDADLATATEQLLAQSLSEMKRDDDSARWGNATVSLQSMVTP